MRTLWLNAIFAALSAVAAVATPAGITERWLYCPTNLQVDQNVVKLEALWRRAAKAGYTHVLLADTKLAKLADVPDNYFRNLRAVKTLAEELHLEIVPALFPIGYSEAILWHDPNLAEALPVTNALFIVHDGVARAAADPPTTLRGGDMSDLRLWDWKDENVVADAGAARVTDPKGSNARISQKLRLAPFHVYHLSVRVRTDAFRGTPEVKLIAGKQSLNYAYLGVKPTQEWTTHHVVFNSLEHSEVQLYLGCWGGASGSLWWDDCRLEEAGLVNLVRRPGAPLTVRREGGAELVEGKEFAPVADPRSGTVPWKGGFEVWHEPPTIKTSLPDGTRLRVSWYHVVTVYDNQVTICPSEPKTVALLRDEAQRVHAAWHAQGYMMSHDEIRVWNWCAACQARHLDAGPLLADNARQCVQILRETNPGGKIYVWSDMFDPNHNAHGDYYLVRGNYAGSWEGLDPDVTIVPWYFERREASLKWFADRGHKQVIAGYYDADSRNVLQWLDAAKLTPGVTGVMYTTWQNRYEDIERFSQYIEAAK